MKYLICFFALSIISALLLMDKHQKKSKKYALIDFLTAFFVQNVPQNKSLNLFLTAMIDLTADFVLAESYRNQEKIFSELKSGKTSFLIKRAEKKEPLFAKILKNLFLGKDNKIKKNEAQSKTEKLVLCLFLEANRQRGLIEANLPSFFINKKYRVLRQFLKADILFFKTDMKKASQKLMHCLPYFYKTGLIDEAAYAHFMLAQMYVLAKQSDAGEILFQKALDLYLKNENMYGVATLYLNQASFFASLKRFDDAKNTLQSLKKCIKTYNITDLDELIKKIKL